jgi:hypothetical protein
MEEELKQQKTNLEITDDLTDTRVMLKEMIAAQKKSAKRSGERPLVITKLEEAEMWALRAQAEEA